MTRIVGLFPQLLGVGGIQEAGRMTAAALQGIALAHQASAEFLSLNDADGLHSVEAADQAVEFRGFARAKMRFTLFAMRGALRKVGNGAPIVLAAHPHLSVVADLLRACQRRSHTVIMTHGIDVWNPLSSYRLRALRQATRVLGPSRDTVQKLVAVQGIAPEKVRRLPWPVNPDFSRLSANSSSLPFIPNWPNGRVILTVGRWSASERYKGLDELIYAFSALRDSHPGLHIVAVGGGDDLPRLRQLATELCVAHKVHFFEGLSREQIAACYAHAEIFALPSSGEGLGLVFLEAMAFAKPLVGVSSAGATDVIENGINGILVPARDVEQLASGLQRLLGDDVLRQRLGQAGAELVRRRFQFATFRNDLEHILADCVGESMV